MLINIVIEQVHELFPQFGHVTVVVVEWAVRLSVSVPPPTREVVGDDIHLCDEIKPVGPEDQCCDMGVNEMCVLF